MYNIVLVLYETESPYCEFVKGISLIKGSLYKIIVDSNREM